MIHIPISDNRIAQFSALFEPHGTGYLYYGDARRGRLPLSGQERDYYIAHFAKVLHTGNRIVYGWVICAAIGLMVAKIGFHRATSDWQRTLVFLLPFPWVMWTWWRSKRLVADTIGHRTAVTSPRSYVAGVRSRIAAFPPGLPVMMIAIGALLLVQQWRYGLAFRNMGSDAAGVGVIAFGALLIWMRRRKQA